MKDPYVPTVWSRADALMVRTDDPTTTQPLISTSFDLMSDPNVFIWDTMPLRDLYNDIISINGWTVIFTLTAERRPDTYLNSSGKYDLIGDWNSRHGRAYFTYWYSRDGKSWIHSGRVMAPGVSPTKAEWAGTPIILNDYGDIELYYTCVGGGNPIVSKVAGSITADENGVYLHGFTKVKQMFGPDGKYYQTVAQFPWTNFRDPAPFIDPVDGKLYVLFEGNVAGGRATHVVGTKEIGNVPPQTPAPPSGSNFCVGCIGLAVATDMTGDNWTMLPPLITAVGVNDQLERPHLVHQDGKYYIFTISHHGTYAPELDGPEGVYGFVSESLFGPYRPLNYGGLVLGNPSSQVNQTYSHLVMKNGMVTSFINNFPGGKPGGVEAPSVRIALKGDRTYIQEQFDYGYIPATKDIKLKPRLK